MASLRRTLPLLLTAGVVASSISLVSGLRANNLRMLELREDVFIADESGQGIEDALRALQAHVTTHMNADLPRLGDNPAIQLKNTYERLQTAESQRVSEARQALTDEATAYCEANVRGVQLSVRAQCVSEYIAARPVSEKEINPDLYRYNFASPRWSPDLAGWSYVALVCFGAALFLNILYLLLTKNKPRG